MSALTGHALRLRIGGLVLAVESPPPGPWLRAPSTHAGFLAERGGDIHLTAVRADVPAGQERDLLFDSGGTWRLYRHGADRLYQFHSPACSPRIYRGVAIDPTIRRGTLFLPRGPAVPRTTLRHPLDELLFTHRLAAEGSLVLHACGLVVGGGAVLLCGTSGAGKSTAARLWRRLRPATGVLSDDRIVVRSQGRGWRAWGTPWHGEARFGANLSRPLRAVFFIRHGGESRARPLEPDESAIRLYRHSFPPLWEVAGLTRTLEACADLTSTTPCFDLPCRPDRTALTAVLGALQPNR